MNPKPLACFLVCLCLLSGCRPTPETLVTGGYDEAEMDAAIVRARTEVDVFIVALRKREGTSFSVKAPIEENGQTEHFWLTDVTYREEEGLFEGVIGNDPGIVKRVRLGQSWSVRTNEISDWMFLRDERMHGNYTLRPLLKTMPRDEAERFRAILVD